MFRVSYDQKPYRKSMMQIWDGKVYPSPTDKTEAGRKMLAKDPNHPGSLGIAISEAIEMAVKDEKTKYALGSVLNHVLLHQTIIGQEAKKQLAKVDEYPDIVIGCFGGGSNFAGITFPFLQDNFTKGKKTRMIAVEPESCPKLTRGQFRYDFGDTIGMTPLLPMFTLGHNFVPPGIHAGGLRYHGAGSIVSQLLKDGLIEASAVHQTESFKAGIMFAKAEGIIPAPESTHAIAQTIREALKAKEDGEAKTILFNLSGHGHIDLGAYDKYFSGEIEDFSVTDADIAENLKELDEMGFPK
jgi:tryptophan synthase beta chain